MNTFVYSNLHKLIYFIVNNVNRNLVKTKLVKLCFLIDLYYKKQYGKTFSGIQYVSYHYGPYSPEIVKAINELNNFEIEEVVSSSTFLVSDSPIYNYSPGRFLRGDINLPPRDQEIIKNILSKYSHLDLRTLLDIVYKTEEYKSAQFGENILK